MKVIDLKNRLLDLQSTEVSLQLSQEQINKLKRLNILIMDNNYNLSFNKRMLNNPKILNSIITTKDGRSLSISSFFEITKYAALKKFSDYIIQNFSKETVDKLLFNVLVAQQVEGRLLYCIREEAPDELLIETIFEENAKNPKINENIKNDAKEEICLEDLDKAYNKYRKKYHNSALIFVISYIRLLHNLGPTAIDTYTFDPVYKTKLFKKILQYHSHWDTNDLSYLSGYLNDIIVELSEASSNLEMMSKRYYDLTCYIDNLAIGIPNFQKSLLILQKKQMKKAIKEINNYCFILEKRLDLEISDQLKWNTGKLKNCRYRNI